MTLKMTRRRFKLRLPRTLAKREAEPNLTLVMLAKPAVLSKPKRPTKRPFLLRKLQFQVMIPLTILHLKKIPRRSPLPRLLLPRRHLLRKLLIQMMTLQMNLHPKKIPRRSPLPRLLLPRRLHLPRKLLRTQAMKRVTAKAMLKF